jgi:hypothetical protein
MKMTTEFQKQRDRALGIVDLEFSDETIAKSNPEILAGFNRVELGESTLQQEEEKLMKQWREIQRKD